MHWIRLDRYSRPNRRVKTDFLRGRAGLPSRHGLPATANWLPARPFARSTPPFTIDRGLNVMAYNRCVGTRYCANNCPYKVRRFNFFDWNKRQIGEFYKGPLGPSEPGRNGRNAAQPGCYRAHARGHGKVHLLRAAHRSRARSSRKVKAGASPDIRVPDGAIRTACQQVCPSEAIVFGDIRRPESEVYADQANSPRDYAVLGYLNTRPADHLPRKTCAIPTRACRKPYRTSPTRRRNTKRKLRWRMTPTEPPRAHTANRSGIRRPCIKGGAH